MVTNHNANLTVSNSQDSNNRSRREYPDTSFLLVSKLSRYDGAAMPIKNRSPFWTIFWIGLVAGTLDIADNLVFNQLRGITPDRVFRYIASGLIGINAARSWPASVALGVAIHYSIALIWTVLFYAGQPQALDLDPAACFLRFGLWRLRLSRDEPYRSAALASSVSTRCHDACVANQWGPGHSALYRPDNFASRAQKFTARVKEIVIILSV